MFPSIPTHRPLRWLATGVLIGLVPLGAWIALAGLVVLAHLGGYRLHLSVPDRHD